MSKVGFITCADLSRFLMSKKNKLFTHDDQLAADFLTDQGYEVIPIIWGEPIAELKKKKLDLLLVRSPWDYMDNEHNRQSFIDWLGELERHRLLLMNTFETVRWNLDKHYLQELAKKNIAILPTKYIEV